ncbi:MAG: hypothetical protein WB610_17680 [Rhodomicrobium sp.]|jgi:hypothetical protein
MRIDFTRPLFDFSGEVLRDGDKPLVLGVVTVNALMGIYPDEQNLDGREKVRRYRLATSIYSANCPLDLPAEDIAMCKQLIGKGFSTLVAGQAIPMLELGANN